MEAKELRIGNLIIAPFYKDPIEIHSICSVNEDLYNRTTGDIPLHSISPILLNDSWFSKFDDPKKGEFSGIFKHNQSRDINGYFLWIGGYKRYIKYVHDYQNLYFALTGEELTIINNPL